MKRDIIPSSSTRFPVVPGTAPLLYSAGFLEVEGRLRIATSATHGFALNSEGRLRLVPLPEATYRTVISPERITTSRIL